MFGYKEKDKIQCQEGYPLEMRNLQTTGEIGTLPESTSKQHAIKMGSKQRRLFEKMNQGTF